MGIFNKLEKYSFTSKVKTPSVKQNEDFSSNKNLFAKQEGDVFIKSSAKRINDYDSNILNKNLIKFLPSNSLRLEMQIENSSKELNKVEKELSAYNFFTEKGENFNELKKKQDFLSADIEKYRSEYREISFANKLTDFVLNIHKKISTKTNDVKIAFTSNTLYKTMKDAIPVTTETQILKDKINNFSLIQQNLTNIASNKYNPFGESEIQMSKYVQFMANANKLNFQINKLVEKEQPKLSFKGIAKNFYDKTKSKINNFVQEVNKLNDKISNYSTYVSF